MKMKKYLLAGGMASALLLSACGSEDDAEAEGNTAEIEAENEDLQEEVSQLENELESANEISDGDTSEEYSELESENDELQKEVEQLEGDLEEAAEASDENSEMAEENEELQEQMTELEEELEDANEQIADLESDDEVAANEDGEDDAEEEDTESSGALSEGAGESTTLSTGTFIVGEDIAAGRYNISTDSGAQGNLFVRDEAGMSFINEILGSPEFGVTNVTTVMEEGDEIEISGMNQVYFEPYESEERTEIGTGQWLVGDDVAPGRYEATISSGSSGNFFVYSGSMGLAEVNEILDVNEDLGVSSVTFTVEAGDVIEISGIEAVQLTEQ